MKTYIELLEPEFTIKKNDGIVICRIDTTCRLKRRFSKTILGYIPQIYQVHYQHFIGTAKLHPDDTWDEALGRKIAESKCKRKIYKFYHNYYYQVHEMIYDALKELNGRAFHLDVLRGVEDHRLYTLNKQSNTHHLNKQNE